MTAEGLAALEAELTLLTTVKRPEVVERIVRARELGDLRENADYEAARNEQAFLEGRIRELERRLRTAVVIRRRARDGVVLGSTVRYEVDGEADELNHRRLDRGGPERRAHQPGLTGRQGAQMGRRAGDQVEVVTPSRRLHYRVIEVGSV